MKIDFSNSPNDDASVHYVVPIYLRNNIVHASIVVWGIGRVITLSVSSFTVIHFDVEYETMFHQFSRVKPIHNGGPAGSGQASRGQMVPSEHELLSQAAGSLRIVT